MSRAIDKTGMQIGPVRLEPGKHESPDEGLCVMELASLRAGEEFSDRPDCVDEVVAAFLRSWNDRASYSDRQRLIPYADRVVGTEAGPEMTRKRRDLLLGWSNGGAPASSLAIRAKIALLLGVHPALRLNEGAGEYAARLCFGRGDSDAAFELLDSLLELGEQPEKTSAPAADPVPERPGDRRAPDRVGIFVLARMRLKGGDGVRTTPRGWPLIDWRQRERLPKPRKRVR